MSIPADFGLFQAIHKAVQEQSWFSEIKGLYTELPPGTTPPYILMTLEGLKSQPNLFSPRARVECYLRVVSDQHSHQLLWRITHGLTQILDGNCFDLEGYGPIKAEKKPFVMFRQISSGWIPGLWNGRWSHILNHYVCYIRTDEGALV